MTGSKVVLIITGQLDPHPTSVINLMNERGIPVFRLNTEVLMTDYDFTWNSDNRGEDVIIKNIKNGLVVYGHQIESIWCRRPSAPETLRLYSKPNIDTFNLNAAKEFYNYLMYYFSDRYSIGHYLYDRNASSKMVQLRLAAKLGIKIPRTCISNTHDSITNFAKSIPDVLIKSLSPDCLVENGLIYDLYATKVKSRDLLQLNAEAFSQTVSFCENYVEKKYEVRVTVMGPYIFAIKIDSQQQKENEGKIDWRQGYDNNIKQEEISLPKEIEIFCKKYLRKLKLNFGCFDFIVQPNGEYVFLECNPNGQWRWIEEQLHLPMTEALVDCLVNKLEV